MKPSIDELGLIELSDEGPIDVEVQIASSIPPDFACAENTFERTFGCELYPKHCRKRCDHLANVGFKKSSFRSFRPTTAPIREQPHQGVHLNLPVKLLGCRQSLLRCHRYRRDFERGDSFARTQVFAGCFAVHAATRQVRLR